MTTPQDAAPAPRLRQGETLLISDTESRALRALADGAVCAAAMFIGVAFNALFMGGAGTGGIDVLVTIALTLAPIFAFLATRPLGRVLLTDQRIFVGAGAAEMDSAELHQVAATRLWLATLFVRLRDGTTLSVGNMRALHALEAEITQRRAQ